MQNERYTGIVSKEKQPEVNQVCYEISGEGGQYTATVPLVPESAEMLEENISHYIFNWNMDMEHIQALRDKFGLTDQNLVDYLEKNYDTSLYFMGQWTVDEILQNEGLKKFQMEII